MDSCLADFRGKIDRVGGTNQHKLQHQGQANREYSQGVSANAGPAPGFRFRAH